MPASCIKPARLVTCTRQPSANIALLKKSSQSERQVATSKVLLPTSNERSVLQRLLDSRPSQSTLQQNQEWRSKFAKCLTREFKRCNNPSAHLSELARHLIPPHPTSLVVKDPVTTVIKNLMVLPNNNAVWGLYRVVQASPACFTLEALAKLLEEAITRKQPEILLQALRHDLYSASHLYPRSALRGDCSNTSPLHPLPPMIYTRLISASYSHHRYAMVLKLSLDMRALSICGTSLSYKRTIQAILRRSSSFIHASIHSSRPKHNINSYLLGILREVRAALDAMVADRIVLDKKTLSVLVYGLGDMLRLESHGALFDEELWSTLILALNKLRSGTRGSAMLELAWADVMLTVQEDIAQSQASSSRLRSLFSARSGPWSRTAIISRLESDNWLQIHFRPNPADGLPISHSMIESHRLHILIRSSLLAHDFNTSLNYYNTLCHIISAFSELSVSSHCDSTIEPRLLQLIASTHDGLTQRLNGAFIRLHSYALRSNNPQLLHDILARSNTLPTTQVFMDVWKRSFRLAFLLHWSWDEVAELISTFAAVTREEPRPEVAHAIFASEKIRRSLARLAVFDSPRRHIDKDCVIERSRFLGDVFHSLNLHSGEGFRDTIARELGLKELDVFLRVSSTTVKHRP